MHATVGILRAAAAAAACCGAFAAHACGTLANELDRTFAQVEPANVGAVVVSLPVDEGRGGRSAALQHAEALRAQLVQRGVTPSRIFVEDRGTGPRDDGATYCAAMAD